MRVIVADATESSSNLRRMPGREPEMDSAAITDSLDAPRMSWGQVGSSQRVRQAGGVRTGLQRPHDADDGAHPEHAIPCEPLQQDAADDRAERYAHPGCADPQSDGQPTHRRSVEQPDDG